ncbi:MAG: hypothetical protein ACKO92_00405, partial [Actinomycetota bacterium]
RRGLLQNRFEFAVEYRDEDREERRDAGRDEQQNHHRRGRIFAIKFVDRKFIGFDELDEFISANRPDTANEHGQDRDSSQKRVNRTHGAAMKKNLLEVWYDLCRDAA